MEPVCQELASTSAKPGYQHLTAQCWDSRTLEIQIPEIAGAFVGVQAIADIR
jgi:hypothetical protein